MIIAAGRTEGQRKRVLRRPLPLSPLRQSRRTGRPGPPITEVLDAMAAKVIYSREDLLERHYGVQPGDTLDSIAEHYQVPALLLARINGIRDPQNLRPGKELKVLKGPFNARSARTTRK